MNFFLNKYKLNKYHFYSIIFLSIIFLRLPFFFTDEFNWDESTYILIGQWVVEGNLPYIERTEVKPPLLSYLFASFIFFSSNEIFLVRLYTCFLLFINLIFLNKIFKSYFNKNFDFVLVTAYIFSSTYIIKDSNALFSENFAVTFLIIGLYYFLRLKSNKDFFLLGFFIACACLIRLNLAIIPIFIFFYLIHNFRSDLKKNINKLLLYSGGGLLVIIIVFLPYLISGNIIKAWESIIVSGLSMVSNAPNSHTGALYYLLFRKSDIFDFFFLESLFRLIFWSTSVLGLLTLFTKIKDEKIFKIIMFYICIFLSIFAGARATAHYLLLLSPICSLFCAYFFLKIKKRNFFLSIYVVAALICVFVSVLQLNKIIKNYEVYGTFYNGLGFDIASHIKKNKYYKDRSIYIYKKHIAYWLLNKFPPTDITHPSDINKEYLFKGWGKEGSDKKSEMIKILDTKPLYLVLNKDISKFMNNFFSAETSEYKKTIKNYVLDKKFDYIHIYIDKNYAG